MKSSSSNKHSRIDLIKRFLSGLVIGFFLATIGWSYSAFFHVSIALVQGIVGSLLLALTCGIVATVGDINKLIDALPHL